MECLKVLFIVSATFTSWANAGQIFGVNNPDGGTVHLVSRQERIKVPTYIIFNLGGDSYALTIDKVIMDFFSKDVSSCKLMSGGPREKDVIIECTPAASGYVTETGAFVKATVYGRWDSGAEAVTIDSTAIEFTQDR